MGEIFAYVTVFFFFFFNPTIEVVTFRLPGYFCSSPTICREVAMSCDTYITYFYLLKCEEPPVCIPCNEFLTVEHIFTNCVDLQKYRNCYCFFLFVCLFVFFLTPVL